jgi:hypothetical protein
VKDVGATQATAMIKRIGYTTDLGDGPKTYVMEWKLPFVAFLIPDP